MKNDITKHISLMALAAIAVFSCLSCGKMSLGGRGKTIIPNVVSGGGLKSPSTKGRIVTKDNLNAFKMKAYAESEWHDNTIASGEAGSLSQPYLAGEYFGATDVSRSVDKWEMAATRYWLNDVTLSFWSWNVTAPAVDPDNEGDYSKARFSLTVAEQATDEPDILFAYNGEKRTFDEQGEISAAVGTRSDNYVNIHFYHALSAIRFDISEVVAAGHTVDRIELSGIYTVGTCEIDASSGTPLFDWDGNSTGTVYENYTAADFMADGKYLAGTKKEFMMIPQDLTASSRITVYFDGSSTGVTRPLGTSVPWAPGKYYGYKIKYTGAVVELILESMMDIDSWLVEEEQNIDL